MVSNFFNLKNITASKNKIFDNEWISVIENESGFVYATESKAKNGNKIAFLGFRNNNNRIEYLVREENVPSRNNGKKTICSLTGTLETNEKIEKCALREIREESGFILKEKDLVSVGKVYPSKCMDSVFSLFTADLTNVESEAPKGDGSKFEKESKCIWVDFNGLLDSEDSLLHSLFLRYSDKIVY